MEPITKGNPQRFAQLLTEALSAIKNHENRDIVDIEAELGRALGKHSGGAFAYWRQGNIPLLGTVESLASLLMRRGHLSEEWLDSFLGSVGVQHVQELRDPELIIRSIEFAPEHYQAGVSILSYFGTVLREKYADLDAKVRIEQQGLKVTLVVESSSGEQEKIEKVLNDYGLVVKGKMSPEEFYSGDNLKALELRQQLRMAQIQLENHRELYRLAERQYDTRIVALEEEVTWLRSHVGELLYQKSLTVHTEGGSFVQGSVTATEGRFIGRDSKTNIPEEQ